ncbi:MAG: adenylate/guanylate cyclase domain-containing protein [Bacteroidetes bacterium]|nr:adenylate/guanylate cyclase domain-containing protein [Bacteroidota bacterium]
MASTFMKSLRGNTMAFICLIVSLLVFVPGLILKLLPDVSDSIITFYLLNIGLTVASLLAMILGIYFAGFKNKTLSGIFITLLAVWFGSFLTNVKAIEGLELKTIDTRFSFRYQYLDGERKLTLQEAGKPNQPNSTPIVLVAINDQSGESLPSVWPWPRTYYAKFIRNMKRAGAKVVGIDVVLDAPDSYSPENDDDLAAAINEAQNVVLAGKVTKPEVGSGKAQLEQTVTPLKKFLDGGARWGFVGVTNDIDGFWRQYLLTENVGGEGSGNHYRSFGIEVLKMYYDVPDDAPVENNENFYRLGSDDHQVYIKKYRPYSFLINFAGPYLTFPYKSFDVCVDDMDFDLKPEYDLDSFDDPGDPDLGLPPGLLASGYFKDKIVLLGATMEELHDVFSVPISESRTPDGQKIETLMAGVEIHANAIHTVMTGDFITAQPDWIRVIIVTLASFLVFFLVSKLQKPLLAFPVFLLIVVCVIVLAFYLFLSMHIHMQIITPVMAIAFTYVGNVLFQYLGERKEKATIRNAFGRYLPEKVVAQLIDNPGLLKLGGEVRFLSILFSDVAGFTTISEKLTPVELVALLNEYLTAMTDIIAKYDGIIDKYEGDAIMAEFGAPLHDELHAHKACYAALEMQEKLVEMRVKWKKEGRPEMRARAGINSGQVVLGNMGSESVFDYTVMGDNVNLASRLEGANKEYGTYIMISEWTQEIVKDDIITRELDLIRVKGKNKPVKVFEVVARASTGVSSTMKKVLESYNQGLAAYRQQRWDEAIVSFKAALNHKADDAPSEVYLERSETFKKNPPGDDWDGVFTMTTK